MCVCKTLIYLVCERQCEVQHLSTQFPFSLVLHVGNLNLYHNGTLKKIHECYIISGDKKLHGRTPGGAIIHHKQLCVISVCAHLHLVSAQELILGDQVVLRLHLLAHWLVLVWHRRVGRRHGGWRGTGWLGHRRGGYESYRAQDTDELYSVPS